MSLVQNWRANVLNIGMLVGNMLPPLILRLEPSMAYPDWTEVCSPLVDASMVPIERLAICHDSAAARPFAHESVSEA